MIWENNIFKDSSILNIWGEKIDCFFDAWMKKKLEKEFLVTLNTMKKKINIYIYMYINSRNIIVLYI